MDKNELKEVLLEVEKEKKNMRRARTTSNNIDYRELITKAWAGRKLILIVTAVFAVLGLVAAFTMTKKYTATVTLVPEMGKSGSSSFSSITSMLDLVAACQAHQMPIT